MKDGFYLIGCYPLGFGYDNTIMLNIINTCDLINNRVQYVNKHGKQLLLLSEVERPNFMKLVSVEAINISDSLHYWYKQHWQHYGKPLVLDTDLQTGEIFRCNGWRYSLMVSPNDTEVRYKHIWE